MNPVVAGGLVAGGLDVIGGFLGNKASADEARRNRQFQRKMYKHRYQYTVEDMRKAGLNPALAYQQGGGSAPSGSMASQDNPIGDAGRTAITTALAVRQNKAQVEQTEAQTALIRQQTEQLRKESDPRAEWWNLRPGEVAQRVGLMAHQASVASATANFLEETYGTRVSIMGLEREQLKELLTQLRLEIELRKLDRAPLEAQAKFASSWFGQNVAPAIGSAGGISGIISGIVAPFLRFMEEKGRDKRDTRPRVETESKQWNRKGSTTIRRRY